jgi:transcriptional regulator with XRE-family HTH domain
MAQADADRGERIKWLREKKLHLTQEAMADKVGVTLRGYQEWEAGGGIKWKNATKLAELGDVTPDWLMSGEREVPDLSVLMNGDGSQSQLDRIEEVQQQILAEIAAIRLALVQPSRRVQRTPRESRSGREATGS